MGRMIGDSLNLHELNNGVASPALDPFFPEDGQEQQCRLQARST